MAGDEVARGLIVHHDTELTRARLEQRGPHAGLVFRERSRVGKARGGVDDLTPGSKSYDFNAMKDTIGCQYGEIVYLSKQVIMVLDEEGKLTGKQINRYATALFQERFGHIDPIVGDVVICHSRSIK